MIFKVILWVEKLIVYFFLSISVRKEMKDYSLRGKEKLFDFSVF